MRSVTKDLILSVYVCVERSDQLGCSEQMIEFMSYVMFSDDQGVFLGYLLYVIG